jgi:putative addiction module killer protein
LRSSADDCSVAASLLRRITDAGAPATFLAPRLLGLEGDWKGVGKGIRELRIPARPGLRIYYAWDGPLLVLLLCGGDKSTQPDDIRKAKACWRDYRGE